MATKIIAWNTGDGNITLTYVGQGNGTITVQSDANNLGSARSQNITVRTSAGGLVTKNLTIRQAACPFPIGDVKNYSYTGNYQEVELPAGQYKLQCWGAQGGSNGTNSTYGITAQAGGKGGYSEGIITLSQKTTIRVYVGGQGSATAGGYNGGGNSAGTTQQDADGVFGYTKFGGGGGATDIRLSDGSLYSRMIVAGGGSGGAMCYKAVTTSTTTWTTIYNSYVQVTSAGTIIVFNTSSDNRFVSGETYKLNVSFSWIAMQYRYNGKWKAITTEEFTANSNLASADAFIINPETTQSSPTIDISKKITSSSTTSTTELQVGYVGGGVNGGGYSSGYGGTQNSAGSNGSFGEGSNRNVSNRRYESGAGGGGWYGGGGTSSETNITYVHRSGGGSGWVNTAASAGNRPSGYTGLQLDSGTTYAGDTSFPNTAGTGNETGHSGNGYAKITRLA